MHKLHNLQMHNNRKEKGQTIALTLEQVKRSGEHSYKVKSQSGNGEYHILHTEKGFSCSCYDHIYRHIKCKHIYAVEFSIYFISTYSS
jgi:putative transposase